MAYFFFPIRGRKRIEFFRGEAGRSVSPRAFDWSFVSGPSLSPGPFFFIYNIVFVFSRKREERPPNSILIIGCLLRFLSSNYYWLTKNHLQGGGEKKPNKFQTMDVLFGSVYQTFQKRSHHFLIYKKKPVIIYFHWLPFNSFQF